MSEFVFPTIQEFREWLEWLEKEPVGLACSSTDCPYAKFLRYMGVDIDWVDETIISVSDQRHKSPKWLCSFISEIDEEEEGYTLTGRECLDILDKVEKEVERDGLPEV